MGVEVWFWSPVSNSDTHFVLRRLKTQSSDIKDIFCTALQSQASA